MAKESGRLRSALDHLQPIIEAGEVALPTVTLSQEQGALVILIEAGPDDMGAAFERLRKILVFKKARTFVLT